MDLSFEKKQLIADYEEVKRLLANHRKEGLTNKQRSAICYEINILQSTIIARRKAFEAYERSNPDEAEAVKMLRSCKAMIKNWLKDGKVTLSPAEQRQLDSVDVILGTRFFTDDRKLNSRPIEPEFRKASKVILGK